MSAVLSLVFLQHSPCRVRTSPRTNERNQASVRVRGEQIRVKVAEVPLGSHIRAMGHLEFSVRQEMEGKEEFELNPDAV